MSSSLTFTDSGTRLTVTCRQVLAWVRKLARPECWVSTTRLAELIGVCKRTVQLALAQLRRLGLVEVTRDYHLRSRRRIRLVEPGHTNIPGSGIPAPRNAPETSPARGGAERKSCAELSAKFALSSCPPPHPPIEEPEGIKKESGGGECPSGEAPPPPLPSFSPPPGKPNPAPSPAPATVPQEVVQRAVKLFGVAPERVAALDAPASWWDRVLGLAEHKRDSGKSVGWGYVYHVLAAWRREGGPPPPRIIPRPMTLEEADAWMYG
jgi:hypothetical protein